MLDVRKAIPRVIIAFRAAQSEGRLSDYLSARDSNDESYKPSQDSIRAELKKAHRAINGENAPYMSFED